MKNKYKIVSVGWESGLGMSLTDADGNIQMVGSGHKDGFVDWINT
jgi:hypothetical protein